MGGLGIMINHRKFSYMFQNQKIAKDIYYVGVNDRQKHKFENMISLPNGVSYNSYLIMDEKTALVDTVDISFGDIFIEKILWGNPVTGWTPIMISVLVIGGFQMLMLGMIGEYLWRTLSQVRNREFYVIDDIFEQKSRQTLPES